MTTLQEFRPFATGAAETTSQPPQPEAAKLPRFTDWISYALALNQPTPPAAFADDSAY